MTERLYSKETDKKNHDTNTEAASQRIPPPPPQFWRGPWEKLMSGGVFCYPQPRGLGEYLFIVPVRGRLFPSPARGEYLFIINVRGRFLLLPATGEYLFIFIHKNLYSVVLTFFYFVH